MIPTRTFYDGYGVPIVVRYSTPLARAFARIRSSRCSCRVPCVGRYRCEHPEHRGHRSVPMCFGADDAVERANGFATCDDCAAKGAYRGRS